MGKSWDFFKQEEKIKHFLVKKVAGQIHTLLRTMISMCRRAHLPPLACDFNLPPKKIYLFLSLAKKITLFFAQIYVILFLKKKQWITIVIFKFLFIYTYADLYNVCCGRWDYFSDFLGGRMKMRINTVILFFLASLPPVLHNLPQYTFGWCRPWQEINVGSEPCNFENETKIYGFLAKRIFYSIFSAEQKWRRRCVNKQNQRKTLKNINNTHRIWYSQINTRQTWHARRRRIFFSFLFSSDDFGTKKTDDSTCLQVVG